jgi:hypothetical protein
MPSPLSAAFVERDDRFVVAMVDVGEVVHRLPGYHGGRREEAPIARGRAQSVKPRTNNWASDGRPCRIRTREPSRSETGAPRAVKFSAPSGAVVGADDSGSIEGVDPMRHTLGRSG